jgi:hypothetical protein
MSSALEKFVQQHAGEFDSETPPDAVWDAVEQRLPKRRQKLFSARDIFKWSAAAAVFFVLLTSAYFLWIKKTPSTSTAEQPLVTTETPGTGTAESTVVRNAATSMTETGEEEMQPSEPMYADETAQMYRAIAVRQSRLMDATKNDPQLYRQFNADLQILDSTCTVLKRQLKYTPNRDIIIKAIMQNLRLQAELLGRQLSVINEFKKTTTYDKDSNNPGSL